MLRVARPIVFAALASACNALTGADTLVAEDTSPALPAGSSGTSGSVDEPSALDSGAPAPDQPGSDAAVEPADSGSVEPPDPKSIILDAKFDSPAECTAWTVNGNGSRFYDANLGRTKNGACVLCAGTAGSIDFERKGKSPRAGKLAALVHVRRLPNVTTPAGFAFIAETASGTLSSTHGFAASQTWVAGGNGVQASILDGEDVTVRLGMRDVQAGDCIVVDDVLVNVK